MNEYQLLWNDMLDLLYEELGEEVYQEIFSKTKEVFKVENNYIYIIVPNPLIKFRIEQFYFSKIKEFIPKLTSLTIGFKFILEKDAIQESEDKKSSPNKLVEVDKPLTGRNLSSLYRFENFVTGESNRYAWLMAMNVAQDGPKVCNPLYIFGDVGLGKTHLMTSIGNFVLDNNINAKVIYTSSQKFAEDYFIATSSKGSKDKIEAFYDKYNKLDLLLVDDIQFLEGKTATQEEFFKIFENLVNLNKQIVLTSDRPALNLKNVMTRLKSRFGWGVSVEIKQPDEELLINILKRKLIFLVNEPNDIDIEVLKTLASCFPVNIRDLEGGLRTFVNYCTCMNCSFTKDNLYIALEKLIPKKTEEIDSTKTIIEMVKGVVCQYFNISEQEILSSSRKQQIAYARHILMYFLRTHYNIPLQSIGANLGSRDHATVSHGIDKINQLLITNPLTKNDYEIIADRLKNSQNSTLSTYPQSINNNK